MLNLDSVKIWDYNVYTVKIGGIIMDQYHHKNLRNALIEKGIELVHEEGLASFSLRKTASACKVSHAAPYSHFQNKEELLEAMQQHISEQFVTTLQIIVDEYGQTKDVLKQLGKGYLSFFLQHPHYFSFLFQQSHIEIDLCENADHKKNYRPFEFYRETLLTILNHSHYPKEKQQDAIIAIWSFVHGITAIATMENVKTDVHWEEKIVDYMDIFECSFLRMEVE